MKNPVNTLLVLILILFATACAVEPMKKVPEEYMIGQTKFHELCANCHGPDAMGGNKAPKLIQEIFSSSVYSNENISRTIVNGSSSGVMPSLKGRVSEKGINEIIEYIRYVQRDAGLT